MENVAINVTVYTMNYQISGKGGFSCTNKSATHWAYSYTNRKYLQDIGVFFHFHTNITSKQAFDEAIKVIVIF